MRGLQEEGKRMRDRNSGRSGSKAWQKRLGALFGGKRNLSGAGAPFFGKSMEKMKKSLELSGTSGLCDRSGEGRTKGKTESVSDRQCDVWADHHSSVFVKSSESCGKAGTL